MGFTSLLWMCLKNLVVISVLFVEFISWLVYGMFWSWVVWRLIETPFFMQKMGLWTILEGFLLLANALAILNEDRFLAPRGWGFLEFSVGRTKSFKGQLIGLIYATQYMRVPLILLNAICIVVKLVSGWCCSRWDVSVYNWWFVEFSIRFSTQAPFVFCIQGHAY